MKKTSQAITDNDFIITTQEELLTSCYGEKGTPSRIEAEIRIKALSKNISAINQAKEQEEKL